MKSRWLILTAIFIAGLLLIIYSVIQHDTKEGKPVAVGLYAPDIEIIDAISGKKVLSSELKGKVLFLNFWASWCNPCREEMASIEGLSRHFIDNQEFILLTILFRDDPQNGINYLHQNGFNFPLMIDKDGEAAKSYGLTGVPETYIIDKKGILREKVIGPYQWDSAQALTLISELLRE